MTYSWAKITTTDLKDPHEGKPWTTDVWSLWRKGEVKNTVNRLHMISELRSFQMCWIVFSRGKGIKREIQLF